MKYTFLLCIINFGVVVVVSQFKRPVANLNARVRYKPNKNDMSKIQDLMKLLPKKPNYSNSKLTKASDYEYCMDKVPIHKMLLEEAFMPHIVKIFIINTIGFLVNLALLTVSFIYRYVKFNPIGR